MERIGRTGRRAAPRPSSCIVTNLCRSSFSTVSGLFPPCYASRWAGASVAGVSTSYRPDPSDPPPYAGSRLGLPADGPGSVAGWGRRLAALTLDWLAASLIVIAVVGAEEWSNSGTASTMTLGVFWAEATLLTALVGGSFGQLLTRVRVTRLDGRPLDLLRAAGRTLLICLVIPPLVFNPEQRGLHDLATGAIALKV